MNSKKSVKSEKEFQELRKQIDETDKQLLDILENRFELSREMALYKLVNDLPVKDNKREKQLIKNRIDSSVLDQKFLRKIFREILKESKKIQKDEQGK